VHCFDYKLHTTIDNSIVVICFIYVNPESIGIGYAILQKCWHWYCNTFKKKCIGIGIGNTFFRQNNNDNNDDNKKKEENEEDKEDDEDNDNNNNLVNVSDCWHWMSSATIR